MEAIEASYLAGFLDGDGSIHFQLVRQDGYRFGYYIRASLSLSQSTSDRPGLEHLQCLIGAGYLRDRGTGMSDVVVTSRPVLIRVLTAIQPFVVFKRRQVEKALGLLRRIRPRMEPAEFLEVAREVDCFAALNHSKTKRISAVDVEQHLRGMGVPYPCNDSLGRSPRGWVSPPKGETTSPITRRPLETG
jgi:LAGLIDADG endonuclease